MLPNTVYKGLNISVLWGFYLGSLPFYWDSVSKKLKLGSCRKYTACITIMVGNTLFLIRAFLALVKGSSLNSMEASLSLVLSTCFVIFLALTLNILAHLDEIPQFVNSFLLFTKGFTDNYQQRAFPMTFLKFFIPLLFGTVTAVPLMFTLDAIINPRKPMYMISIFANDEILNGSKWMPVIKILTGLIQCWLYNALQAVIIYHAILYLTFACCLNTIAMELRPNRPNYSTKLKLRSCKELGRNYKSLQLLDGIFNNCFRNLVMPAQELIAGVSIMCNYLLITMAHKNELLVNTTFGFMSMNGMIGWLIILSFAATTNKVSNVTLNSWKHFPLSASDRKYVSKVRKSCRPLSLQCGMFYKINMKKVLLFLKQISWGTLRIILLLRPK